MLCSLSFPIRVFDAAKRGHLERRSISELVSIEFGSRKDLLSLFCHGMAYVPQVIIAVGKRRRFIPDTLERGLLLARGIFERLL